MTEEKNRGGRPTLPAGEKREKYQVRIKQKYHAALDDLGAAWIEALLEVGFSREQWSRLLGTPLPAPTKRRQGDED